MTLRLSAGAGAVALALAGGMPALAQESDNRVAAETDWSVFVEEASGETPKECWGVTAPKESVNTRDGQPVTVRRGDVLLFVTYRPGAQGEVSFTGGYPFAEGSTVELDISGTKFDLFVEGEWAWSGSPEDDGKILTALKAGSSAILTGRSGRGTQTQDTFSLMGVSAALDEAAKQCAG